VRTELLNAGTAIAARMPIMAITITNSISVKAFTFFIDYLSLEKNLFIFYIQNLKFKVRSSYLTKKIFIFIQILPYLYFTNIHRIIENVKKKSFWSSNLNGH
jgi:hypothetical protein